MLMVSYDDTMADPVPVLKAFAVHLGSTLSDEKAARIAEECVKRLKPGEAARNTEHVRSPGVSTSRQEIPEDLYAELCAMEAAAGEAGDTISAR